MFKINLLENPNFIADTSGWTLDSGLSWNTDEIYQGYPTINFNIKGKIADAEVGLISNKMLVRPNEIYSASVYCRTSDYTLFDGTDTQVTLYLQGYENKTSYATILGQIGKNKADFPAQDWFRMKLEDITIPSNIHYVSVHITLKRNGKLFISYPCLEIGDTVSEYELHQSDIGEYYNSNVYEGILETDELVKTENTVFNELDENTMGVIRNNYLITADEDGIKKREDELGIIADTYTESLEFRRQRVYNKLTSFLPFPFTFFKNKLDDLIGVNKWNSWIDFDTYTINVEYVAENNLWSNEIEVFVAGIKPCNMIFKNSPVVSEQIKISEQINLRQFSYLYKLNDTWQLGEKPFTDCTFSYYLDGSWELDNGLAFIEMNDKGIIKMANFTSIQTAMLKANAQASVDSVHSVLLNDTYPITTFDMKKVTDNVGVIEYQVLASYGVNPITNIKLLDADGNTLTNSTVYVQVTTDSYLKHKFTIAEGV